MCRILTARPSLSVALLSALFVSVAFQAMTIARNNYNLWRLEFMAIEVCVAVASSWVGGVLAGSDERGDAWTSRYARCGSRLHGLLRVLPSVAVRAAVMTACLAVVNATAVPMLIYHEVVVAPVLAVPIRFLADIPQGFALCLAARLLVDMVVRREAEAAEG